MSFTSEERLALSDELYTIGMLLDELGHTIRQPDEQNILPAAVLKTIYNEYKQQSKETFKTLTEFIKQKGTDEKTHEDDD